MRTMPLILLFLLTMPQFITRSSFGVVNEVRQVASREVSLDIKIAFVGFDEEQIDTGYLKWNLPERRHQTIAIPGLTTNVIYKFNYELVFADESFLKSFTNFMGSIAKSERSFSVLWNETYFRIDGGRFLNYTYFRVKALNTYYPADAVEDWLIKHSDSLGGLPRSGYMLVIADLAKHLPSVTFDQYEMALAGKPVELTPHYYNKTYFDADLDFKLNAKFMTAWGGRHRLYYVDLSSGPSYVTGQLPLQLAASLNKVNLNTKYGRAWLSQYVADYVWNVVFNLFAPDLVYPISYSKAYNIKILAVDNRTRRDPPIDQTINHELIKNELKKLIAFSEVNVELIHTRIEDYPELLSIIRQAVLTPSGYETPIVDARIIYHWLSENGLGKIKGFFEVSRTSQAYDIPVFVFAFSGDYNFGFTYKEWVAEELMRKRAVWGAALYDLALISHSERDLRAGDFVSPPQPGSGFGFTQTIIHEVGHMLGLMHPFSTSFDLTENFVASVMAYYPYEYSFSRFDVDAFQRGHADLLIRLTHQALAQIPLTIPFSNVDKAKASLQSAEAAYAAMDYAEAVKHAYLAMKEATSASRLGLPQTQPIILAGVVALITGMAVGYMIGRRRERFARWYPIP